MNDSDSRRDLAIRCVAAAAGGGVGLVGPDAAAAATALTPVLEAGLCRVYESLTSRRRNHAADTLLDAAEAAGAFTDEAFLAFVDSAVSSEKQQELLARTLAVAQDAAMRDKRRALGRALAAGVADHGTRVDEELLFIRVLGDLDAPHVRLLRLMDGPPPSHLDQTGPPGTRSWMPWMVREADPGLSDSLYTLLLPLQRHGLIWSTAQADRTPGRGMADEEYTVTSYGQRFLDRLAESE